MRIAQVAPLIESVPPQEYGGTERVVSWLTDELVRQGHDVTLYASGDSETRARLRPMRERSVRSEDRDADEVPPTLVMLERLLREADDYDVIHFHLDHAHFPFLRRRRLATVTTLHNRLDLPELSTLFDEYREVPLVSISDAQREPLPQANWQGTVHHGLPPDILHFEGRPGEYLAFIGRISPEKRVDRAIEIAKGTGIPLKIAATVNPENRQYYDEVIEPMLDAELVEFVGEVDDHEKQAFLAGARALLFPINWPEPFGLVMIEAMACGTPVIAYRRGAVPEVMEEGATGFVVSELDDAIHAVQRLGELDRARCRAVFDRRFTVERMARDYVRVYQRLIQQRAQDDGGA